MRYAFTTTVKDGKMEEYLHYHDHIWPEVCRGLRAAGVTQLTIFRAPQTATLFLYVTTAGATDLVAGLGGEPTILLAGDDGALENYALQAECTHLGCLVGPWNPISGKFVCPCHGSEYSKTGAVSRGPAPSALKLAKVSTDDQGRITLERWTDPDFRQ